jgi:uncharacterized membrane protein
MLKLAVAYVATALVFLAVDAVWLSAMANTYKQALGDLLAPQFRLAPAVLFYLLFIAGLIIFAVSPALTEGRWQTAALYGALFGFFCYATYDLTNHATLRVWPAYLTAMDMVWGTALSAASATAGYAITSYFFGRG